MNPIKELIDSCKSGWYFGKANSRYKKKDFKRALIYYKHALKHSEKKDKEPYLLECIAMTFYRMDCFDDAMNCAKLSLKQYESIGGNQEVITEGIKRIRSIIDSIESAIVD